MSAGWPATVRARYLRTPISRPRDCFEQLTVEKLELVNGRRKCVNALGTCNEAFDCRAQRLRAARAVAGWTGLESLVRVVRPNACVAVFTMFDKLRTVGTQAQRRAGRDASKWMNF